MTSKYLVNINGLLLCARYAYPPNSLSLCGPDKHRDLKYYSTSGKTDRGTKEILEAFSTLYPYLSLIAYENDIRDPFDSRVVEAYWLGNRLLNNISVSKMARHLKETLSLKKKTKAKDLESLLSKLPQGGLPHHAFHVLNIYKRTGHIDNLHTIQTMDACIVNWGKIKAIKKETVIIQTTPLTVSGDSLVFAKPISREIMIYEDKTSNNVKLRIDDCISYHWGMFCQKLTAAQIHNLIFYTNLSLSIADKI